MELETEWQQKTVGCFSSLWLYRWVWWCNGVATGHHGRQEARNEGQDGQDKLDLADISAPLCLSSYDLSTWAASLPPFSLLMQTSLEASANQDKTKKGFGEM